MTIQRKSHHFRGKIRRFGVFFLGFREYDNYLCTMNMSMNNQKIINWRNFLSLSGVSYALYLSLWFLFDEYDPDVLSLDEFITDFVMCMVFTLASLVLSRMVYKILPFKVDFLWAMLYSSIILLCNNVIAYGASNLIDLVIQNTDSFLLIKGTYINAMIASFVSGVYTNMFYLQTYLRERDKKQELELELLREKEIALQSQFDVLKLQINPHFLFNSFNSLLSLIEEKPEQAEVFLSKLSKVYRYIITNIEKQVVPVSEEVRFLETYLYLMKVRHNDSIIANIDESLKSCKGYVPPSVLQLLVENAIKHNGFSHDIPLYIDIRISDRYITVSNNKQPLRTEVQSFGLGQKVIKERYALLSEKKVEIEETISHYAVSLPIIDNVL